jgi:hypothetical protein
VPVQTPREILNKFYQENHLGEDGGDSLAYVKVELSKGFHFYFPNFDLRRKAVILHDIHHIVSGYSTDIFGESEISAWEIASGCKKYWVAFAIDTSGVMIGIPINFTKVLKAYARGRRTKNLYHETIALQKAMDTPVDELKKQLQLDVHEKYVKPRFWDFLSFAAFSLFGLIYSILSLTLLPFIILYSIYTEIRIRIKKS